MMLLKAAQILRRDLRSQIISFFWVNSLQKIFKNKTKTNNKKQQQTNINNNTQAVKKTTKHITTLLLALASDFSLN